MLCLRKKGGGEWREGKTPFFFQFAPTTLRSPHPRRSLSGRLSDPNARKQMVLDRRRELRRFMVASQLCDKVTKSFLLIRGTLFSVQFTLCFCNSCFSEPVLCFSSIFFWFLARPARRRKSRSLVVLFKFFSEIYLTSFYYHFFTFSRFFEGCYKNQEHFMVGIQIKRFITQ